jgi:type I restriction enzyme R subunit
MLSNKETLFQDHLCAFLAKEHQYETFEASRLTNANHIIEKDLIAFIKNTQPDKYQELENNSGTDADREVIVALELSITKKELWLIMREGLTVKGTKVLLYAQKPRSTTNTDQAENYAKNTFTYKKEYYYNPNNQQRIDIVIWLNGLPIIVLELKHEDEGQDVNDAIHSSFLNRELNNPLYKNPFLYVALSNTEAKISTNPNSEKNFRWFNTSLNNKAETEGEYPVEHVYRYALSPENICHYLEHYLVFVPSKQEEVEKGELKSSPAFTIFPRYHQFRASKSLAEDVQQFAENKQILGKKYLINHSAGSGKTLTIAWMADRLDSLYTSNGKKVFNNIIILTDRNALDKNVKDDLELFTHLSTKINFARNSKNLAEYLENNRSIIVTTIHKFAYIQGKLEKDKILQNRNVAFLIDEAHRSQDGKMALTMRKFFNDEKAEASDSDEDETLKELQKLNISNQVFVAFTATTTPKTVSFFGEPFDVYSEQEAIAEGYILDVAHNIISYETLYNLKLKEVIPDNDFPIGIVSKLLKNIAYEDDAIIQYKAEVIVKLFEEKVVPSIQGQGKAMVVTSSRIAGLKYFNTLKTILEDKESTWKVLYAFSDFTHPITKETIEENKLNELDGKLIEDVFSEEGNRILVVANKFQTGFDQPLLSTMFLDKSINGVNAIQTVSRLNRKQKDKEQEDILVVDFTNNAKNIFDAFNKHRTGSPYKDKQPEKKVLVELFEEIVNLNIFTAEEIETYVNAFINAELEARERNSTADATLSNLNQDYRNTFRKKLSELEAQKSYVSLLRRYTKLYYFIAQFFELTPQLNEFIVFAEVMSEILIRKGKTSEMKEFLKKVELSKGAVKFTGTKTNLTVVGKPKKKTGFKTGKGGHEIPRTTIEIAIKELKEKFQISEEDAIQIKEIVQEVSETTSVKKNVLANRNNIVYLKTSAEPNVQMEVKSEYVKRKLWDKLDDPMYVQKGGIISLIGKTVIQNLIQAG